MVLPIHVIADMGVGTMTRHGLTPDQWSLIEPLLPPVVRAGRPPKDRRRMLNGTLWILRTGAPRRDLPERFGSWRTVCGYFQQWRADGTFNRLLPALQIRLDREGKIDSDLWCIDGSSVRAARTCGMISRRRAGLRGSLATSNASLRIALSSDRSATSFFSRAFSSSNTASRRASSAFIPPYLLFQR